MTINEMIDALRKFDPTARVFLEDLNGLLWKMEQSLIRGSEDGVIVIVGAKDVNLVRESS